MSFEYKALIYQLSKQLPENVKDLDKARKQAIKTTYLEIQTLNTQLTYLYTHTGIHQHEIDALKRDQDTFDRVHAKCLERGSSSVLNESVLENHDDEHETLLPPKPAPEAPPENTFSYTAICRKIRKFVQEGNPIRFFIARCRRLFVNTRSIIVGNNPFDQYFFSPFLRYIAWIFLLPRLCVNLFDFFWYVIPHSKLSEKERALTWQQRAKVQLQDKASELSNDLIWVPGNMLACFLLIGGLASVGLILGVAMFAWDVVRSLSRAKIELSRLSRLIVMHEAQGSDAKLIDYLKQQQAYQIKVHSFQCFNAIAVTVLTFFASNIVPIPLFGLVLASVILIVITIISIYMNSVRFEKMQPTACTLNSLEDKIEKMEMALELTRSQSSFRRLSAASFRLSASCLYDAAEKHNTPPDFIPIITPQASHSNPYFASLSSLPTQQPPLASPNK